MALPVIAITNESTVLTDAQVEAAIPSLQKQVTNDFRAYWDADCTLTFLSAGQALTSGWWQIVILDDPDQAGALGYHELTEHGAPLGKVFARLDMQAGSSWTVTLSHELLEMLGDPWINWCAEGSDQRIYALEVCDAVEDDSLGYEINGVLVSDFVTPAWYEQTSADRFDFKQHLSRPLELAKGGYISVLDQQTGWNEITARGTIFGVGISVDGGDLGRGTGTIYAPDPPVGSRRYRRRVAKPSWRKSLRTPF